MKNLLSIGVITAVTLVGAGVEAAELPSYELVGFPITPTRFQSWGRPMLESNRPASRLRWLVCQPLHTRWPS
jgi:hypothetical protein